MLDNILKPEVIKKGTKLLDLQYKKLNINARDTLSFCALKLADFPKAVSLNHLISKGEFPHLLNKPENWDKILDFPAPEMYMLDSCTMGEKKKFMGWHGEENICCGGSFDFRAQIVRYCLLDVTVLRLCALKFRQDYIDICKIDPSKSVTIASACQKFYRTFLLKKQEVAVISGHGYQANRKTPGTNRVARVEKQRDRW